MFLEPKPDPPPAPNLTQMKTESGDFFDFAYASCAACAGFVADRGGRDCLTVRRGWCPRALWSAWYALSACLLLPKTGCL